LSARLAARPETRGRNTAELNISICKELSRTSVCKGQNVVRVAADLGFTSVICQSDTAGSDTKRPRISTLHMPVSPSPIYALSQRLGLNECSKPLYAQGRASSAAYGNRFVSGFWLLSMSLASDPSSQMSSPGPIRGDGPVRGRRTQCPDEASRGATRSQITTETIASSMAITTRTRNARVFRLSRALRSMRSTTWSFSVRGGT
jgi:hypothetical protein